MKTKRAVDHLYKQIAQAEKGLARIRKNCKHKEYRVELYSWRIGSIMPQRLCKRCDAVVPGITDIEAEPFIKELNAMFTPPQTLSGGSNSIQIS